MTSERPPQSRRGSFAAVAFCFALVATGATVRAQSGDATSRQEQAETEVESYLEHLGLGSLRAELLLARVQSAPRDQRISLAERLAKLYVELLTSATTAQERERWEGLSQELLKSVPEADGFELRLNLAKAIYLRAEESAERFRLRLHAPDEAAQAEAALKSLEPQFREIAARIHKRVESLERIEESGDESEELRANLSEARRLRSLAFYYAGWSNYYVALLSTDQSAALDALKCFGWLLNNPNNRPALLEKVTPNLFRYEHVSRAALGAGLSAGLRGSDVEAIRWLDALESSEDVPPAVKDQLFSRRMIVLAGAKRWADLERLIRKTRNSDRAGGGPDAEPLGLWDARLLAVLTLDASSAAAVQYTESLARIALADLVARGEVGHVMDLVDRFGTTPMGDTGFIVNFVRAVREYDRARELHADSGEPTDEPTGAAEVANVYRQAVGLFTATDAQPDAAEFPADRARARTMLGRALFYSGSMVDAADAFHSAFEAHEEGSPAAEEALWLAILSLDRATQGQGSGKVGADVATRDRRDQLAAVYLQSFPDSPRAGRLLLMRIASGLVSDDEAARVLESVPPDSPVYPAARRQLARLLYESMRKSRTGPANQREIAALRFAEVADQVIAMERRELANQPTAAKTKQTAERIVVLGRQLLDALLGVSSPDGARAQAVLDGIEAIAAQHEINLGPIDSELTFRRVQIRLAVNDEPAAIRYADELAEMSGAESGEFVDAASRLLFRPITLRWRSAADASSRSFDDAELIVRFGMRILNRIPDPARAMVDPAVVAAYNTVAESATALAKATGQSEHRDLALKLDGLILQVYPRAIESLSRTADLAEAAGDIPRALECWNIRFSLAQNTTPEWFEARYNVIRLLISVDPKKAIEQLNQYRLLYPDLGPEPWGSMFRELEARVSQPASGEPVPSEPAPASPAGGSPSAVPDSAEPAGGGG